MEAKVGDLVKVKGILAEISDIHYQEWYEGEGWSIEFTDTNGNYRNWKQCLEGGEIIQK